jgi:hypothetical protein
MATKPLNYYPNREIWNSGIHRNEYLDKMKSLGTGLDLPWQDDNYGSITLKRFVLKEMSSIELKTLERDLRVVGVSNVAEDVHKYRVFKVRKKLAEREDRQKMRRNMLNISNETGIDLASVPLQKLDKFILEIWGRPRVIGFD